VQELEPLYPDPNARVELPEEPAPAPLAARVGAIAPPHPCAPAPQVLTSLSAEPSPHQTLRLAALTPHDATLPTGDYINCAIPLLSKMRPAAPRPAILAPDTGHRLTLPGPRLTKDLESLGAAGLRPTLPYSAPRPATGVSGWAISFTVMMVLLFLGGAAIYMFAPKASAETKVSQQENAASVPDAAHPLGKFVEVTGIRIIVDYNKRSEIHYLLVNHSATELNDVSVQVTLINRSAKPGQPPVAKFIARINGLGPFESKEMVSPIEKPSRAVALPEWQDLRAEAQVGQ
jgi:hypothetical protein